MITTKQRSPLACAPRTAPLVAAVLLLLAGCNAPTDDGETGVEPARPNDWPVVTSRQAGEAVSDAMLITSQALYLAIATNTGSREVTSDDGLLRLSWSEDADFLTGIGTYEIALDGYAIAADDPFSEHYHGYALTGTIRLASAPGADTRIDFALDADHADGERFPAKRIELRLGHEDADTEDGARDTYVRVNAEEFPFEDLAASF
jgi:hypothetical protein